MHIFKVGLFVFEPTGISECLNLRIRVCQVPRAIHIPLIWYTSHSFNILSAPAASLMQRSTQWVDCKADTSLRFPSESECVVLNRAIKSPMAVSLTCVYDRVCCWEQKTYSCSNSEVQLLARVCDEILIQSCSVLGSLCLGSKTLDPRNHPTRSPAIIPRLKPQLSVSLSLSLCVCVCVCVSACLSVSL